MKEYEKKLEKLKIDYDFYKTVSLSIFGLLIAVALVYVTNKTIPYLALVGKLLFIFFIINLPLLAYSRFKLIKHLETK